MAPASEAPCPICGGRDYAWGGLEKGLFFKPDGAGWADSPVQVRGRRCKGCGNVQLFAPNP